jgi:hypothetical protein
MREWRVGLFSTLIVGGVVALTAACTSGGGASGEPTTTPSVPALSTPLTTSSSSTASQTGARTTGPNVRPGEEPPVLTAEAKQHNQTGALFFALYYMRAKDWSLATMDTYLLKQTSLPSCTTCRAWVQTVEKYASEGAYAKGGRLVIGEARLIFAAHADVKSDYIVDIKFVQQPDVIVRPSTPLSTDLTRPESQGSYVFVSWVGNRWRVVEEEADS